MKIVTVVGARPQFIKASALSRAIRTNYSDTISEVIVHTGQHYDWNLSDIFRKDLQLDKPDYPLNVGSGTHGRQTGRMTEKIEEVLLKEKPDCVVVYGDTNSTLAASLAAAKLNIPIAHVEAGLRSYNKTMPEEINRLVCDHVSTFLFTPTKSGLYNLIKEGFNTENPAPFSSDRPGIFCCGDIMYDNNLFFREIAKEKSHILQELRLEKSNYCLATVHRPSNTDVPERMNDIFCAFEWLSRNNNRTFVLPLHPRTVKAMNTIMDKKLLKDIQRNPLIKIIEPVGYLDMLQLEQNCRMVFTDSGGLQKEAYFFNKPVIILRPETEWTEIEISKSGLVTGAVESEIIRAHDHFKKNLDSLTFPPLFGEGKTAGFVCTTLVEQFG